MIRLANQFIRKIEKKEISLIGVFLTFLSLITVRILIENWLGGFQRWQGQTVFYEWSHVFLSLGLTFLLFLLVLQSILKISFINLLNILLLGFLIIWTPPLTDYLVSHYFLHGQKIWSYYEFSSLSQLKNDFLTFFSRDYSQGTTYGVCLEIALAILFLTIYAWIRRGIKTAWLTALVSYFIFFVLGTLPSWPAILVLGWPNHFFQITDINIAQFFLSPAKIFAYPINDLVSALNVKMSLWLGVADFILIAILLYKMKKKEFIAWIKNGRWPQVIYHQGLFLLGASLALIFTHPLWWWNFFNFFALLIALEAVLLAWWSTVAVNDIFDQKIDTISNPHRPYIKNIFSQDDLKNLALVFLISSVFLGALLNWKIAGLLLAYHSLAWLYSAWPLRLKRIPLLASFISALASLLIFFIGYILVSPNQSLIGLPSSLIWLLLLAYTFSLPVKDLKDVKGDKKNGVWTIPVCLGEYWGRVVIASGVFLSFVLSVIILNEKRLSLAAFLSGSLAFWLIMNRKLNPRWLPGYLLGIIIIYGLLIVKIVYG